MAVVFSVQTLEEAGFVPPRWEHLATGAVEVPDIFDADKPRMGWQATAARAVETHFWGGGPHADALGRLLRSQGGPLASAPLHDTPHGPEVPVRRPVAPQPHAAKVAPSSPADDALVRVWPSSRPLGPSPRRVLSGRNLGLQEVSLGDGGRPHLQRSGCEGHDERLCP